METIQDLMIELEGADPETVNRIAWEKGSLPVRLAMLGLASLQKGASHLWWGYPPGVFIGYKWNGDPMREYVLRLAEHIRGLGYRTFLDAEDLDKNADAYFQIPQFITSLQDSTFYMLLLTEVSADMIDGRKHKATWIHDEYQHAVRIAETGRLFIVPVLLEPKGIIQDFTLEQVIDLTVNQRDFGKLSAVLTPGPLKLSADEVTELTAVVAQFDKLFLNQRWEESDNLLRTTLQLGQTFDHQFRRMLLSIYTADQASLKTVLNKLYSVYGKNVVDHMYNGYCTTHEIPNQLVVK